MMRSTYLSVISKNIFDKNSREEILVILKLSDRIFKLDINKLTTVYLILNQCNSVSVENIFDHTERFVDAIQHLFGISPP